jgi:hypothetical protein
MATVILQDIAFPFIEAFFTQLYTFLGPEIVCHKLICP